ncbi:MULTISPECIES: hypothetical protein [Deefgea]|uniref:Uncharacterized protein n=1 Tax=Deefgea chitinilytica TaxID=570276 RepID=A0ABS2CBL0_9NEIS|nr:MULTISPECIES: hypothetical protein [Deefgea]MBM5571533.1 hypothetical protein [Deefgea chitinilytica]MBM9888766.1 hypothetical protein [Deefgea sp. CFH1-16]
MALDSKKVAGTPQRTATKDPKQISVKASANEPRGQMVARVITSPELQAAISFEKINKVGVFCKEGEISLAEHLEILQQRSDKVVNGDLTLAEVTLVAQMQTLDGLFNLLAQRALNNVGHSIETTERYLRMAFKAQSQCRATIETLAEVKSPRVAVFANQANISSGAQQVNNGTQVPAHGAMQSEKNITNELLEHDDGERLDTRKKGKTSRANQNVAAVGKVDGRTNKARKVSQ